MLIFYFNFVEQIIQVNGDRKDVVLWDESLHNAGNKMSSYGELWNPKVKAIYCDEEYHGGGLDFCVKEDERIAIFQTAARENN